MLFKRYLSEGLAHFSYLIADNGQAAVIDPRRDVDAYLEDAAKGGYHINRVLETHRNEDYLVGSLELANFTGAELFHADGQWDYHYGCAVEDGQTWQIGRLRITAIHTPGHTPGSMSYLLHDPNGEPWVIFTGDTLFSGDAGRVDLLGEEKIEAMAGHLYDSIYEKILPLGDEIIVCPAHGAGSVCGSEIAERTWTTIGLERKHNRKCLAQSKAEFFQLHAKMLERPHYFRKMEHLNLVGPLLLQNLPILRPLRPDVFMDIVETAQIVDTRDQVSFGGAHLPGSLNIWAELLPNYAGWFLNHDSPILFVCDENDSELIIRVMIRIGFDHISGYLAGGVVSWGSVGKHLSSIDMLFPEAFCQMMKSNSQPYILDVRGENEIAGEGLHHGKRIHLTQLPGSLNGIPKDRKVVPVCASGYRSMLAASLLEKNGWTDLAVPIGGLSAWKVYGCDFIL